MNVKHVLLALAFASLAWTTGCPGPKGPMQSDRPINPSAAAGSINVADADEATLVEKMAQARLDYRTNLEALHEYYVRHGMYDKQMWAEKELKGLKSVPQSRYLVATDLPPAAVTKPTTTIAPASELYQDAMTYYSSGRVVGVPLAYSKEKMRIALEKFDRLIKDYPQSDKVADALFYGGEILKEYFDENLRAAEYYKRAYEADPNVPHPAHFQRAVVLDYRLHMRDEALKEYYKAIEIEGKRPGLTYRSNADFAATRVRQLLGQ